MREREREISFISQINRPGWPQRQCLWCFYLAARRMAGAGWPSESDRYGKGLCVVLGDKAVLTHAFVRTLNHQSEKTLISIFTKSLSSVSCARLCRPLLAVQPWMQDELMILWNLSNRPSATFVFFLMFIRSPLVWFFAHLITKSKAKSFKLHFLVLKTGLRACVNNVSVWEILDEKE